MHHIYTTYIFIFILGLCIHPIQAQPASMDAPPMRGIALGLHGWEDDFDYCPMLDEIAAHHANWVALHVSFEQLTATSTTLLYPRGRDWMYDTLATVTSEAHARRLSVMWFPIVLLSDPGEGEWRGKLAPASVDDWFDNYGEQLTSLAHHAKVHQVEAFSIGSEFASLEKYENHWRALIEQLREAYRGQLLYSANWDHYRKLPFWDAVDIIAISGYYELVDFEAPSPTLEQLEASWRRERHEIKRWLREHPEGTKFIFSEIGYPNLTTGARYPWDYTRTADPSPVLQERCYRAFINVWRGDDALDGVFFYDWFYDPATYGEYPALDPGYSPRGKPAAETLAHWYRPLRPGAEMTATTITETIDPPASDR